MTEERLDEILDEAMRVERVPDLWRQIAPRTQDGFSWREIWLAFAIASTVLLALTAMPREAASLEQDWEPVALKSRLRVEAMAASWER